MEKTHRVRLRAMRFGLLTLLLAVAMAIGFGSTAALAADSQSPASASTASIASEDAATFTYNGVIRDGQTPLPGVQVTVSNTSGFSQTATTDAAGAWAVTVPEPGTYTVTLVTSTLPAGITLRDASFESRDFEIGASNTVGVLFPFGEAAPAATGGDASADPSASAGAGDTSGDSETPTAAGSTAGQSFGETLLLRIVTGLNFGLLLALGAIGITLIYGTTGVNNFAHGEMLTFGGYSFFVFTTVLHWPFLVGAVLTVALSAAFGWAHDAAIFKPLRRKRVGLVQVLIVTIGLSIALRYFYQFLFGGGTEGLAVSSGPTISLGIVNIKLANIIAMIISVVVLLAVGYFLTRTRVGKATRAVSDNPSLAAASGIDVDKVIRIVWVLAGTLTGLAGLLYTYFIGAQVRWDMGFAILLLLFAAVTLGGLGSAFGALVGALIIGLVTEISTIWLPPDIRYAVALVILILVLLFRPQGVLGRKERVG